MAKDIGVGIVGSRFMAGVHADSVARNPDARVVAVASPNEQRVSAFAEGRGIPRWFTDHRRMLELPEVDLVIVTSPNDAHAAAVVDAGNAGKHVIVEKPLCLNLDEADAMIAACRDHGVKLMYAEEFCFAPKYVRAKQVVDEGGIGRVYQMKHVEKSMGSRNPWYWDLARSGGWPMMQLTSHSLGIIRWMIGRPRATHVYADVRQVMHGERGAGEDDVVLIVTFEDGTTAVAENSWAKRGGMEDRMEIFGTEGVIYANLYEGSAFQTFSENGYGYSSPGGAPTTGWTRTVWDELYNNGFPQEIDHFIACVKNDLTPQETGEDGRAVIEIIMAAYESARTGSKVALPFHPKVAKPIDLWRPPAS